VNIASGALILVLLIFPAVSFRFAINRSAQLKELVGTLSIPDTFWAFLFVPVCIHGIVLSVIHFFLYRWLGVIRFDILYDLINGAKDPGLTNADYFRYTIQFLLYNGLCLFVGYVAGYGFARLEDQEHPIRLSRLLGLDNNNWYSLLDGRTGLAAEQDPETEKIDLVYVDVLANRGMNETLYSGFLFTYYFKHNSKDLGHLVLQHALRREVGRKETSNAENNQHEVDQAESPTKNLPKNIRGEFFIIPAEQIVNINVTYVTVSEK
jgi:hypothetical protein